LAWGLDGVLDVDGDLEVATSVSGPTLMVSLASFVRNGKILQEERSMATMNISLPDAMKEFVEAQAAKQGFGSVSEYLRAIIRDVQKRQPKQDLKEKLLEGLRSGPATPMTAKDWDQIEREGLKRLAAEKRRR
jgi:antitoxin ParD1/3/4